MTARIYEFRPRPRPDFSKDEALWLGGAFDNALWQDEHGERHEPDSPDGRRLRAAFEARNTIAAEVIVVHGFYGQGNPLGAS